MIKPILIVHQTTQDKTHIVVKWVTYFVMSFDIWDPLCTKVWIHDVLIRHF